MKRIIVSIFIIVMIIFTGVVYATEIEQTPIEPRTNAVDSISIDEQELESTITNLEKPVIGITLEEDIYTIEEKVELKDKNIQGNVYIIAEEVNLESVTIDGNLFLIGQDVELKNSMIYGSAYLIAEDFKSNSQIKDLYLLGDDLNLQDTSYIERNARILGTSTNLSGIINNNCYLASDNIKILENTVIKGTLDYYSNKEAEIKESASIGDVSFHLQEQDEVVEEVDKQITKINKIYDLSAAVIKVIVISGAILLFSSKIIKANRKLTVGDFFKNLGIGSLILIFIPLVALALIVSILGAGLGLIMVAIYAIAIYVSNVVSCLAIASAIVKENSKWKIFGITILIYMIVKVISILSGWGILLNMLLGLAGLGFLVTNVIYKESKEEIIVEKV